MGTSAKIDQGIISFATPESARESLDLIKSWVEKAASGNLSKELNGDYNIYDIEYENGANFIMFSAYSHRYQNLEWQIGNLRDFCKQLKDIEYFDASVWIQSDESIFWENIEEDEEA
jgi:hypothetical protein